MTRCIAICLAAILMITAQPAHALWTLEQRNGFARTTSSGPGYTVEISCRRGARLQFTLRGVDAAAAREFRGVRALMMWITVPDGRTDRWPVDVVQQGNSLTGELYVSDFQLNFFRQGKTFEIDAPGQRRQFLDGDMKGSGAARLAFLEQCGI